MDGCEALQRVHRRREGGILKYSSVPAEKNNGTITRASQTKEVNSRYKSPTPVSRRCASPNVTRSVNATTKLAPKRANSTERKRAPTPQLPSRPTTPVHDTSAERKVTAIASRLPESLWPSTMRSLSVSFQSDSISFPVSKKEKPVDRTLKPSSNVAHKQAKRDTPEGRNPLKGRTPSSQSENSKPADGLQARLIDQHRWPSRAGVLMKNMHLSDKAGKSSSDEVEERAVNIKEVDETALRVSMLNKLNLSKSSVKPNSVISGIKSYSLSARCMGSPSRTRPSTPTSSRGTSPSRIRPSSPTRQLSTTTSSVLSFASDLKRGKKSSNQLEDAHHLRLLYNRHLQWRFANAQADAALHIQKAVAEETLYNVWWENLELWDSVIIRRVNLQRRQLELKLNVVLNEQLAYLEDWASLERDHSTSLTGVINDLESSTLRLPITDGATASIVSLKSAISSAAEVMQAMTSSFHSVLPKVQRTSCSVSELAALATLERATLDECEAMLASTASMQVEEYSLRAQLIQQLQGLKKKNEQLVRAI